MFRDDLLDFIKSRRQKNERVVLMMDANENVVMGVMSRELAQEGIDMKEAVHGMTEGLGPKTHFRGKESIDGIWVSTDLEVTGASYLPFDPDVGDHRPVMIDITMESVLGATIPKIVPVKARRLNSKIKRVRDCYIEKLELLFHKHDILEKLRAVQWKVTYPVLAEAAAALEKIDNIMEECMIVAEKGCRKIRAGQHEYSPAICVCLDCC